VSCLQRPKGFFKRPLGDWQSGNIQSFRGFKWGKSRGILGSFLCQEADKGQGFYQSIFKAQRIQSGSGLHKKKDAKNKGESSIRGESFKRLNGSAENSIPAEPKVLLVCQGQVLMCKEKTDLVKGILY